MDEGLGDVIPEDISGNDFNDEQQGGGADNQAAGTSQEKRAMERLHCSEEGGIGADKFADDKHGA